MRLTKVLSSMVLHSGGCHCGGVRFEVTAPAHVTVTECNCSICHMSGYRALIVPSDKFKLIRGEELLANYRFNTGAAKHIFCSWCGVKSFYIPRSHPAGVSVNVRCLDRSTFSAVNIVKTNGQDWESQYADGGSNEYAKFPGAV